MIPVFFDGQACLYEELRFITVLPGILSKGIPYVGAVAQLELLNGVFAQVTVFEITEPNGFTFFGIKKLIRKIFLGLSGSCIKAFLFVHGLDLLRRLLLFLYLNIVLPGQEF